MRKGIDLSNYDGKQDWLTLREEIDFVILRGGYGKNEDPRFKEFMKAANDQGIPFGVYWFCYALNAEDAANEAKRCIAAIGSARPALPVFYDFEYDTVKNAAEQGIPLGRSEYSAFCGAFLGEIRTAGFLPGLYYNPDYYKTFVNKEQLEAEKWYKWLAHYTKQTDYAYDFWQYGTGKLQGSSAQYDLDYLRDGIFDFSRVDTTTVSLQKLSKAGKEYQSRAQVKTLQRLLKVLGYRGKNQSTLAIDGSFGGNTDFAVRNFQKKNGLTADGICGDRTWDALLR